VGDAVRRSGNPCRVWDAGDGTQRLGGLAVGLGLTICVSVGARVVLVFALTGLEGTILGPVWGIVGTSDAVVDVFTEAGSVGTSRVAGLDAEEVSTKEAREEG